MTTTTHDWRQEYIVCPHVHADPDEGTHHRGMRVCCNTCYPDYLSSDGLVDVPTGDGLAVRALPAIKTED